MIAMLIVDYVQYFPRYPDCILVFGVGGRRIFSGYLDHHNLLPVLIIQEKSMRAVS